MDASQAVKALFFVQSDRTRSQGVFHLRILGLSDVRALRHFHLPDHNEVSFLAETGTRLTRRSSRILKARAASSSCPRVHAMLSCSRLTQLLRLLWATASRMPEPSVLQGLGVQLVPPLSVALLASRRPCHPPTAGRSIPPIVLLDLHTGRDPRAAGLLVLLVWPTPPTAAVQAWVHRTAAKPHNSQCRKKTDVFFVVVWLCLTSSTNILSPPLSTAS
jgi:hypothetical protein